MNRSTTPLRVPLAELRDRIDRIAAGTSEDRRDTVRTAPMGLPAIDAAIGGGLETGAVHEVIGHTDSGSPPHDRAWSPPVGLVMHIADRVSSGPRAGWIVWIGASVWPHGGAMPEAVRERSVFVDARTPGDRVWGADVALRCGGESGGAVGCVVVDGSGFEMGATRRVQVAARSTGWPVGIAVRPPHERGALSVASSRWVVRRREVEGDESALLTDPGWIVECVRCKGVRRVQGARWSWAVEWCCATRDVRVVADVADRSGAAPDGARGPVAGAGGRAGGAHATRRTA